MMSCLMSLSCRKRAGIAEVVEFGIRQPVADAKFINKC